jgi:hypothetical protein
MYMVKWKQLMRKVTLKEKEGGLEETRTAEPKGQELLPIEEPKAGEAGSGKPPQAGDIPEDSPQNKGGAKEKLIQIVAVPKEKEEIKDEG